jgi:EAL domain-containing protein (putative c-di-GMP-specific phosphodiesterase class I)
MRDKASDRLIVRSVVDLGHNLGLQVVAEGVEDDETWRDLEALGCDQVQGYVLSRPIPATDLTAWLARRRGRTRVE